MTNRAILIIITAFTFAITLIELATIPHPELVKELNWGSMWFGFFAWAIPAGAAWLEIAIECVYGTAESRYCLEKRIILLATFFTVGALISLAGIYVEQMFVFALWANIAIWLLFLVRYLRDFSTEW